jgi:hypothetical protein
MTIAVFRSNGEIAMVVFLYEVSFER